MGAHIALNGSISHSVASCMGDLPGSIVMTMPSRSLAKIRNKHSSVTKESRLTVRFDLSDWIHGGLPRCQCWLGYVDGEPTNRFQCDGRQNAGRVPFLPYSESVEIQY